MEKRLREEDRKVGGGRKTVSRAFNLTMLQFFRARKISNMISNGGLRLRIPKCHLDLVFRFEGFDLIEAASKVEAIPRVELRGKEEERT